MRRLSDEREAPSPFWAGALRNPDGYLYEVTLAYWHLLFLHRPFRDELLALFQALAALPLSGPCPLSDLSPPLRGGVEALLRRFRERWPLPQPREGGLSIEGWREVLWENFWLWRHRPAFLEEGQGFIYPHCLGLLPRPALRQDEAVIRPPTPPPISWNPALESEAELEERIRAAQRLVERDMRQQAEAFRQQLFRAGWRRESGQHPPTLWARRLFQRYVLRYSWARLAHEEMRGRDRLKGRAANVRPQSLATKVKAWAGRLGI